MRRRWPWLVSIAMLALPAPAAAGPDWVTPVSPVSGSVNASTVPLVASNARGDTAIAWKDVVTGRVNVSDRPVGGAFSLGTEVSTAADQLLGNVQIDGAGNIYVFFITDSSNSNASRPWVGIRPAGSAASWDLTPLAAANSQDPPQANIAGAVAPDGRAVAVWFQGHTNNALQSVFQYSTKAAGSTTWAGKQTLPGFVGNAPGQPSLAINSSGEAAIVFSRQGCNRKAVGATMNASGTWTSVNDLHICANNSAGLSGFEPVVGIDEAGTATAVWLRNDAPPMGSGSDIVQFTTKPIEASSWPTATASPSPNDLSATGVNATSPVVAVAPDGTTTVAWIRGGVLQERTRPAGGSAFSGVTSIPSALSTPGVVQVAAAANGATVAMWTGSNGTPKPDVGAAFRAPGASSFAGLPDTPGEDNTVPSMAIDGEGNAPAAWLHQGPAATWVLQATGLDTAGPAISNVVFPATADPGSPFSYGATLSDRWSTPAGVWGFGDGTTGPLSGSKTYPAAGTFTATLSASDSVGNNTSVSRQVVVGGGGDAPRFLSARLTNAVFAVNRSGAAEKPVASRRAKRGTTFVYSLSEDARVVFKLEAKKPGRRSGRRCVKPTKRNRRARRCTRFVRAGAFAHRSVAGQNRKKFSGKIGKRRLRPGRYRASLVATDADGKRSPARRLNFRVVRR
jgi:hypothetical protein